MEPDFRYSQAFHPFTPQTQTFGVTPLTWPTRDVASIHEIPQKLEL
jgi:hypothetical protein